MKPFSQGKKSLPVEPLRPPPQFAGALAARSEPPRGGTAHPHGAGHAGSAQVEVIKEGDKIVRLVVNCVCGERVEIECLYSAGR